MRRPLKETLKAHGNAREKFNLEPERLSLKHKILVKGRVGLSILISHRDITNY